MNKNILFEETLKHVENHWRHVMGFDMIYNEVKNFWEKHQKITTNIFIIKGSKNEGNYSICIEDKFHRATENVHQKQFLSKFILLISIFIS